MGGAGQSFWGYHLGFFLVVTPNTEESIIMLFHSKPTCGVLGGVCGDLPRGQLTKLVGQDQRA